MSWSKRPFSSPEQAVVEEAVATDANSDCRTGLKKATLQSLCDVLELGVSGNKDELVDRVIASGE